MTEDTVVVKTLIIDFTQRKKALAKGEVAVEEPLIIYVNNQHLVTLLASPSKKKELILGHLLAEGIIKSLEEVKGIRIKDFRADVRLTKTSDFSLKASMAVKLVTTACGSTKPDFLKLLDRIRKPSVTSKMKVDATKILEMMRILGKESKIYKSTHGTHSAAIFTSDGELVSLAEDVGRHNAVDKVIGDVALKKVDFTGCLLLSTGRQPADMVLKAARVGIPVVVSLTHPLESGIKVAEKTGITLVQVRGTRMTIYTHATRVVKHLM